MNTCERSAMNLLGIVRECTDTIGVAISFGKDSLATLDLCCRIFPNVHGYYLFRVRDMRIVSEWTHAVEARYNIKVNAYPHFDLVRCYVHAVLQPHWPGLENTPRISMSDIENIFRRDTDVDWIAYGWRRNDSFSRALIMKQSRGLDWDFRRVFPLRAFRRKEVYAYLDQHHIQRPPTLGRKEQGGLDFVPTALQWLKNHYPDDWQRWLVDFPFSEAQICNIENAA